MRGCGELLFRGCHIITGGTHGDEKLKLRLSRSATQHTSS